MNTDIDRDALDLDSFTTQVDDTYHALRAFNFLLENVNEYAPGGVSGTIAYGTSHLLRRQIDDLEEIRDKVFDLTSRLRKAEEAAGKAHAGLPDRFVILPTYDPRLEREVRGETPEQPAADPLRGADLGAVARDTNLAEATVRRVLERLLAEPRPGNPQSAASNG